MWVVIIVAHKILLIQLGHRYGIYTILQWYVTQNKLSSILDFFLQK
jgi:hypothetical protein